MLKAGGQEREGKGSKLDSSSTVEFILKLHPKEEMNSDHEYNIGIIQSTFVNYPALSMT